MATKPYNLTNGTTADADEVDDDLDELYTNIDSSNVASANKTGTGDFVLQTGGTIVSPIFSGTITGTYTIGGTPTVSSPIFSGTITGTYTIGGTPTIASPIITGTVTMTTGPVKFNVASTYLWISQDAGTLPSISANTAVFSNCSAAGDNSIASIISGASGLAALYFGDTASENQGYVTYDNATDALRLGAANGTKAEITLSYLTLQAGVGLILQSGQQIYLDGGGNSSIRESSADVYTLKLNNSDAHNFGQYYSQVVGSRDGLIYNITENQSNTSNADAYYNAIVAGTSAGDPYFLWQIGSTTGFAMGPDNSDSDKLKIRYAATGATPSNGTSVLEINTSGEMLLPDVDPPTANWANRNSFVKAWATVRLTGNGASVDAATPNSYNITSVSMSSTTQLTVTLGTDMASGDYTVLVSKGETQQVSTEGEGTIYVSSKSVGSFDIRILGGSLASANVLSIHEYEIMVIGDQ